MACFNISTTPLFTSPIQPNKMYKPIKTLAVPSFPLKAYTPLQLSAMYEVGKKTFNKWLVPFASEIGERRGHYYNIIQVQIIIEKIGFPGILIAE